MIYTTAYESTGPIIIGVHGVYIHRVHDVSQLVYIYAYGMRTYAKVGLQHVWRPMERDDVV